MIFSVMKIKISQLKQIIKEEMNVSFNDDNQFIADLEELFEIYDEYWYERAENMRDEDSYRDISDFQNKFEAFKRRFIEKYGQK